MNDFLIFLPNWAEKGDWQTIKKCIEGGFAINELIPTSPGSEFRKSLLHIAAQHERVDLARHLLRHGANVSVQTSVLGETPLHCAATTNCVEMAELLLKAGASVNAIEAKDRSKGGNTPLHYAAEFAQPNMIASLLANGADPNFQNNAGETPLHHLASFVGYHNWGTDRVLAAKVFVTFSGRLDLRLKDNTGKTAIEVASKESRFNPELRKVVSLFRRRDRRWWKFWTW